MVLLRGPLRRSRASGLALAEVYGSADAGEEMPGASAGSFARSQLPHRT